MYLGGVKRVRPKIMHSFHRILFVILCTGFSINLAAQVSVQTNLVNADKNRLAYNYSKSLKLYKEVLTVDAYNTHALDAIIDIYMYDYELYDSAKVYLDQRIKIFKPDTNYLAYYKYADCLRMMEQHQEALKYYYLYKTYGPKKGKVNQQLIIRMNANIAYCQNALTNQEAIYEPYTVENMGFFINSIEREYTPVFIESDSLLLYNARYKDYDAELMSEDNKYFENIYYFDLIESVASTFNPEIDQKNHVAVVSRTYGGDTILVCYKNTLWLSSFGADRLKSLVSLPVPLNGYYFQPHGTFSGDNKTFIFSAKAEHDNLDLYVSYFENGAWSMPVPLSHRVNSGYDEDGPSLSKDGNTLYFSSKGHNSSGGYDFYVSHKVKGEWTPPVNMGYPMNSAGDDIYITWTQDGRGGFFSSNRFGGFGGMDIYSFELVKKTVIGTTKDKDGNILAGASVMIKDDSTGVELHATSDEMGRYSFLVDPEMKFSLLGTKEKYFDGKNKVETFGEQGTFVADLILEKDPGLSLYLLVIDKATNEPIDSVKITVTDNMTGMTDSILTSLTGDYFRPLADKKLNDRGSYNFSIEKKGYLNKTVTFNILFDKDGKYNVHEYLDVSIEKVEVGQDLSKIVELKPIYFDLGKATIRPDAALELDKIVKVMNDNPNMIVELGSHTDSRGNAKSNQTLSDKRAKSSADYIKQRITNPDRIKGVGYGESKLKNECGDGVTCPEEKHQENRRTEFIIISM
jgi:outer membrane protein OmpA-like peptidoglycan-associated protein/tetratricopeptide (TPR) repeat protein